MARKPKAAQAAGTVAVYIDTKDAAEAEREYEKAIEGWAELPEPTRKAIIEKTVAHNSMRRPPRMRAGQNAAGELDMGVTKDQDPTLLALELTETFGAFSIDLANARLVEMLKWYFAGDPRGAQYDFNAGLAFVHGCEPKSPVEATLATQMVLTNSAALRALNIADRADNVPAKQVMGNLAVKLLRTFTAQAEALSKIQRGGEQVVKHIHLDNRGGQAIVTDTIVTGGLNGNGNEQPYEPSATLLGSDPFGGGMPIASDEGPEAVPTSRRVVARCP